MNISWQTSYLHTFSGWRFALEIFPIYSIHGGKMVNKRIFVIILGSSDGCIKLISPTQ